MPECQIEDCYHCARGLHHPNRIIFYDSRTGEYILERQYKDAFLCDPEGEVCVARWHGDAYGDHFSGELCGRQASERIGDVPVCSHHARRAADWFREQARTEHEERVAAREAAHRQRQAQRACLVYFVERDGFVKIGYTTNLKKRLNDIGKGSSLIEGMTVGPVRLLATVDGGDLDTESWMHKRFAHLRVGGEWFLFDDELRAFIAGLKGCVAPELKASA